MLAADILIAVISALAATILWCQFSVKQSEKQFFLKLFFLTATVLSYAMLCAFPIFEYYREKSIAERLEKMGWALGDRIVDPWNWWMIRPWIDLGIVDEEFNDRVRFISWKDESTDGEMWTWAEDGTFQDDQQIDNCIPETAQLLQQLRYCEGICICSCVVSNEELQTLSTNWKGCRILDLGNSIGFDDAGFAQVLENWSHLEYVTLSGTDLSDQGILALKNLPNLTYLVLDEMEHITIHGVLEIVQKNKTLKYLRPPGWLQDDDLYALLLELAEERGIEVETSIPYFSREKPDKTMFK